MATPLPNLRRLLYVTAATAWVAAVAACASSPPAPEAQGQAAPAVAATASSSAPAAKSPQEIAELKLVQEAWQEGLPVHVGFLNGVAYYCWSDDDIGSMLPTRKCETAAQLKEVLAGRRQARDGESTNHPLQCGGKDCGQ